MSLTIGDLTVARQYGGAFTVRRHIGPYTPPLTDGALLSETGDYLALESGELLLA